MTEKAFEDYMFSKHNTTTVKQRIMAVVLLLFCITIVYGQTLRDEEHRVIKSNPDKDKEKKTEERTKAKRGIRTWTVNEQTGLSDSVAVDTPFHLFQNSSFTTGKKDFYSSLGNLGSPFSISFADMAPSGVAWTAMVLPSFVTAEESLVVAVFLLYPMLYLWLN